jgi:MFS family permease
MPLMVPHGTAAGLTSAAFSLPGVFVPITGSWADRTGRPRDLLIWGTLGAGSMLLLFEASSTSLRILLAAGAGLGAMAATTAGNVVATHGIPEAEWESRVALLQRFTSAGQVIGLIAAGVLARSHSGDDFVVAGMALLAAGVLAFLSAPSALRASPTARCHPRRFRAAVPGRRCQGGGARAAVSASQGRGIMGVTCPGRGSRRLWR